MSLHTGCSAHTDWEQSVSPQECQTKSRADGLSRQTLTEEGVGKKGHHSLKKKKKKCQGALRARFPVQAMDCKTLPVLTRGKRFMSVMSVLKKIAAIKLTIFQMGTGGPLGQKRHN